MTSNKFILGLLLISLTINIDAQSIKGEVEFRLTLRDGNIVTGTSNIDKILLETDYGKLEIPVKNVNSLELGISSEGADKNKITGLAKQLSNSNEELRKGAYDELVKMGVNAIPVISDFIYSSKYEPVSYTNFTIESALSELISIHNISEDFSDKDVVSIDYEYTMGGIYSFKKINLKTEYGILTIPKDKIQRIEVMYHTVGDGSEKIYKLFASKHISSNQNGGWLKTGIMVKNGGKINITASGEAALASLSGNKYKPDGSITGQNTDFNDYNYGYNTTYPTYGNVVYKISESGQMMRAGDKFKGIAKNSGILYLSIYETVYNASNTGSYIVKVSVQ